MKTLLTSLVLTYLRLLARLQVQKNKRMVVIGITGSAGKSSTRRALTLILSGKGRVKESVRANSESGIPLNILGLAPINYSPLDWLRLLVLAPIMLLVDWRHYDFYVVEMGIDSPKPPKNMSYLLKIIRPHIAVLLNAGLVHGEAFDFLVKDRDPARRTDKVIGEIAKEKFKLALGVDPAGSVIINTDQPDFKKHLKNIRARVIKLGRLRTADFKLGRAHVSRQGFSFSFSYQGQSHTLTLPDLYEENFRYTFGAAIAAAAALGISPSYSIDRLGSYRPPAGRLRVFRGIKNSTIIDSSYNASPATMESALKLLHLVAGSKYKLAVVGDMRELGVTSKHAHRELARQLQKYADEAILYGLETKSHTLPRLETAKFPVHHFGKMNALTGYLHEHLPRDSFVLVKGSQNTIFLERAVESLLADPANSKELCRRGRYWDRQRRHSK